MIAVYTSALGTRSSTSIRLQIMAFPAVSALVLCFWLATHSVTKADTCQPDQARTDCGYFGINQQQCEDKECCWQPANNQPYCFYKSSGPPPTGATCHPDAPRSDCGFMNQQDCENNGCCWSPLNHNPWCFHQSELSVYMVNNTQMTALGVKLTLMINGSSSTPYGPLISPLMVDVSAETNERLHIKIYDPSNPRWEIPTSVSPVPTPPSSPPSSPDYTYHLPKVGEEFYFAITRTSTMETIFNTSTPAILQFVDQFLQISASLPTNYNLYGLGEHVTQLRLQAGQTYTLWNFDTQTPPNLNLYGSHPFYLDLRPTGNAHGVFLRNSNAMDVVLATNSLTYRVIGGVLDFYFFLGPEPEAVIQQYEEVIGRPHMPPYWALGFHQCRYGYHNVEELQQVVANYSANKIPLDTMWTDIDYMDQYKDFTLDPNNFPASKMQSFVSGLHSNGQHYVVITDPGIKTENGYKPYDDGVSQGTFIKDHNGNIFTGKVWPGICAFPDFLNPKAQQYWQDQISDFYHNLLPVDGLWVDMNEISNFCNGECTQLSDPQRDRSKLHRRDGNVRFNPNSPPYQINNQNSSTALNVKTLDMDAQHYGGVLVYNAHNIFWLMEDIATRQALESVTRKRAFVISRSTFPSSGAHAGHWTGDNHSSDKDMYYSIPGMLNFQMFGVPLVGSDICGFIGDTTEELCSRWIEVGSFYPFSRDHNNKKQMPQELYRWPSVAAIGRKVLAIRYSLLPYYYTLFYKAHRKVDPQNAPSATVTRPLFFEFPKDVNTYSIDRQFMVGSALLISPVLEVGSTSVSAYFPAAKWYDWYTHQVTSSEGGETKQLDTPVDHIQVHLRGGSVVPMQDPGLTTTASRANNFSLLATLDGSGEAQGDIFLDDGVAVTITNYTFVTYSITKDTLTATVSGTGYATAAKLPVLNRVVVVGVLGSPTKASLNGQPISGFSFDASTTALTLTNLAVTMDTQYSIVWQ